MKACEPSHLLVSGLRVYLTKYVTPIRGKRFHRAPHDFMATRGLYAAVSPVLNLDQPSEWPAALKITLTEVRPIIRAWEFGLSAKNAANFDHAINLLSDALKPYSIRGWHCTRLTDGEVNAVEADGLVPMSIDLIERRIAFQVQGGLVSTVVGDALRAAHLGSAHNRAGMIWFCFFPPKDAGEDGIHRLLRYWGGEAVYLTHGLNGSIASVLRQLGRPCIVEADVPVASLSQPSTFTLARLISRRDLNHRGGAVDELYLFEGYAVHAIPGDCIRVVHRFPSASFTALSGCDGWRVPLS